MGRGVLAVLIVIFLIISLSVVVLAQENVIDDLNDENNVEANSTVEEDLDEKESDDGEVENDEFSDFQLKSDEGITPDSGFYFVDEFFDKFGDDIKVREEKIAEIRVMIREGNIEAAKIALENYKDYADKLEKEVDPEQRDEAQRSVAAIRNAIREIENDIPREDRGEFVDNVLKREKAIFTAVEIASRIKELCEELSSLDPTEYARICRTKEDSPNWQKKLDKKLTKEQEKEAREFGEIMRECFRTQGRECRCSDITIKPFANRCSVIAPLAAKCEDGDESACEAMDDASEGMEDLLPDYLQDVMADIERRYGEDRFDLHIPEECIEEGAKTAKECMKVMFRLNAPEECIKALDEGRIDLSNEREARKACEEIMFKENAPQECIDAGLKDPKECGKLMFKQNAPEECVEAGLTGENRNDHKKCEEIMRSQEGDREGQRRGFNPDCRRIENAEERLKCYDGALEGNRENREDQRGGWPQQCEEVKAFTRESCEAVMREFGEKQRQEFQERREEFRPPQGCGGLSPEECSRRFEERREEFRPPEGEGFISPEQQPQQPVEEEITQPPTIETSPSTGTTETTEGQQTDSREQSSSQTTETTSEGETGSTESSSGSSSSSSEDSSSSSSEGTSGTTGMVISDNEFFNYYYK